MTPDDVVSFGSGRVWRFFAGLSLLFMLLLFLGSLLHPYLGEERDAFLTNCGAPIGLVMVVLWSYLFLASFHRVHLFPDRLLIEKLGRRWVVMFDEVTAVNQNERLAITTTGGQTHHIHLLPYRQTQAQLCNALQQRIPALHAARQAQLQVPLPLRLEPRRMVKIVIVIYLLLGLGLGAVGVSGFIYTITDFAEQSWPERIFVPLFSLACLAIMAFLLYLYLGQTVWRYTFSDETVQLRYAFWTRTVATASMMDMELAAEPRTYRGVTRILYTLNVWLADGEILRISPNGAGLPGDYSEAEEKQILTDLMAQLRHHYGLE